MKTVPDYLEDLKNSRYKKQYEKLKGIRNLSGADRRKREKARRGYRVRLHMTCQGIWSNIVHERADWKCELCGKASDAAHHVILKKACALLRHDTRNGVAVCIACHGTYMGAGGFHSRDSGKVWNLFNEKFPRRYGRLQKMGRAEFTGWTIKSLEKRKDELITEFDYLTMEKKGGY